MDLDNSQFSQKRLKITLTIFIIISLFVSVYSYISLKNDVITYGFGAAALIIIIYFAINQILIKRGKIKTEGESLSFSHKIVAILMGLSVIFSIGVYILEGRLSLFEIASTILALVVVISIIVFYLRKKSKNKN